jgi:hypothetical protein
MHVYAQWTYTHAQTCKCTERFMCMHEHAGLIMCVCVCVSVCIIYVHIYMHSTYTHTFMHAHLKGSYVIQTHII